ncbi:MAG: ABC transporter permease, partial [Clostridia bacterium]|nr:ABC transporter permease [Clostridia bacterium]
MSEPTSLPRANGRANKPSLGMLLLRGRTFIALAVLLVFFGFRAPNFTNWSSLVLMVKHASVYGLLALGMTLVIITGGIDLSVGAVVGLSAMIAGGMVVEG